MLTSGSGIALCWLGCGQRSRPSTPRPPAVQPQTAFALKYVVVDTFTLLTKARCSRTCKQSCSDTLLFLIKIPVLAAALHQPATAGQQALLACKCFSASMLAAQLRPPPLLLLLLLLHQCAFLLLIPQMC
jgi:hypothetical protein